MAADVAREFLGALMGLAQVKALLSSDHFLVDGTLIDVRATMKSFQPKDGSGPPQGPGAERRAWFPWPKTQQREPCQHHRP